MSTAEYHNKGCERAIHPECVCTACSGSQHGWTGWLELATAPDDSFLTKRAEGIRQKWESSYRHGATRQNAQARQASLDLARLDIILWLRGQREAPRGEFQTGDLSGSGRTTGPGTPVGAYPDRGAQGARPRGMHSKSNDPAEQAIQLAEAVALPAWACVRAAINQGSDSRTVKRQLASHTWCDLFIAMALCLEQIQSVTGAIPELMKRSVKDYILHSPMQAGRPALSGELVEIIADTACDALVTYMIAQAPVLQLLLRKELLQSFRILAYLACPNPDRHRAVREHALKPLNEDAREVLTEKTKKRLTDIFPEWSTPS